MGAERPPPRGTGRGGGWVAAQAVLFLVIAVTGVGAERWPPGTSPVIAIVGAVLLLGGFVLAGMGIRQLGPSLTPFPAPLEDAELREGGVYAIVRHPIYGGVLLAALGWSLVTSPWALVPSALLVAVFEGKRRREEAWLVDRHPGYAAYRQTVPRRYVPFVV